MIFRILEDQHRQKFSDAKAQRLADDSRYM